MKTENKIIAIRKKDVREAHQAFAELMDRTENMMNEKARCQPNLFRNISTGDLECCSVDVIRQACDNTPFDPDEVRLVAGHRFPDIVADSFYGVEVKQTISDSWISTGSSIVESTRVKGVEDIYMLFGKLGGVIPEFKCRPYQDVLYDIAVTHSPRYLINMELNKDETIFTKLGTDYDVFRQSSNAIEMVRKYYRERALAQNKQEMPWWITSDNVEQAHPFTIKLWNSLDLEEKRIIQAKCMILFPEALNPARNKLKYNNTTLWLCSYNQIVNPNIRDMYSAGGKITHVDGVCLDKPVAQVFNVIVESADVIKDLLANPSSDLYRMIQEFNPTLLEGDNLFEEWVKMCDVFARANRVPLREWIERKPSFKFSKR